MSQLINIHSHRKSSGSQEWCLRNGYPSLSVDTVWQLAYPLSIGLHPWHVKNDWAIQVRKIEKLANLKNVLAIGETGLDLACNVPLRLQLDALHAQLRLAEEFHKPVILHCVQAFKELIPELRKYPLTYIFHDFRGDRSVLESCSRLNSYYSFGKNLWDEKNAVIFKSIGIDRVFLETDSSHRSIREVYEKACKIRSLREDDLNEQLHANLAAVLYRK